MAYSKLQHLYCPLYTIWTMLRAQGVLMTTATQGCIRVANLSCRCSWHADMPCHYFNFLIIFIIRGGFKVNFHPQVCPLWRTISLVFDDRLFFLVACFEVNITHQWCFPLWTSPCLSYLTPAVFLLPGGISLCLLQNWQLAIARLPTGVHACLPPLSGRCWSSTWWNLNISSQHHLLYDIKQKWPWCLNSLVL